MKKRLEGGMDYLGNLYERSILDDILKTYEVIVDKKSILKSTFHRVLKD